MTADIYANQRNRIRSIASEFRDPELRARRVFFDEQSFATAQHKAEEFQIKSRIATYFDTSYRSIVFCGSAHLGFSPTKDKDFVAGSSDLDIAIINHELFQYVWTELIKSTRGFSDLTRFSRGSTGLDQVDLIRDMMSKRGLIHLHDMPAWPLFDTHRDFLRGFSESYLGLFSNISVSFYINEYAFCWKQSSSLQEILGTE
jgi:hypothetical protein